MIKRQSPNGDNYAKDPRGGTVTTSKPLFFRRLSFVHQKARKAFSFACS
jgi:hypothetical protein